MRRDTAGWQAETYFAQGLQVLFARLPTPQDDGNLLAPFQLSAAITTGEVMPLGGLDPARALRLSRGGSYGADVYA